MSPAAQRPVKTLLRLRVDSIGEAIYRARRQVVEAANRLGFEGEDADRIDVAFTEALANAVRHGSTGPRSCVHVRVLHEGGLFIVEVADHGRGFVPDAIVLPSASDPAEGGRGLYLMKAFMDSVEWLASPKGTIVRLTKRVPIPLEDKA